MKKKQFFLLMLLCASTIFIFSNSLKTAEVSSESSGRILALIDKAISSLGIKLQDSFSMMGTQIVRKSAHVIEFLLQSTIMCTFLYSLNSNIKKHLPWALLLGLFTACFDESLQMSARGRGPQLSDVWIDFSGCILGILVFLFILKLTRLTKNHMLKK